MRFVESSYGIYSLSYHIVWVTKYRRRILNPSVVDYLKKMFPKLIRSIPGVETEEISFDKDHIHLLVSIPPKMSVGSVVRIIKSNTAKDLKKTCPFLKKRYFDTQNVWSDGYFVSIAGINQAVIQRYIEHQGREDLGQA